MATKSWDSGYQDLLSLTDIIALEPRRAQASLCMLFKIVHGLCFFPANVITTRPNHSQRTNRQLLLQQPFAGTNAYLHSFVPHTVHAWNLLPGNEAIYGALCILLPFRVPAFLRSGFHSCPSLGAVSIKILCLHKGNQS